VNDMRVLFSDFIGLCPRIIDTHSTKDLREIDNCVVYSAFGDMYIEHKCTGQCEKWKTGVVYCALCCVNILLCLE